MNDTRRRFLMKGLFGTGWLGLRALATGLPMSILAGSRRADASPTCTATAPQYLVLLTSIGGDPLNANVPGCYLDAGIYHPPGATMTPTAMTLGGSTYTAAKAWTQLSPAIQTRTCFFHHATYTNAHGDAPKVNRLMGAVKRQEMMISSFAQSLAPCLSTVQSAPVVLSPNLITSSGAVLPTLNPVVLKTVLSSPTGPLSQLQLRRDQDLDALHAMYKATGRKADAAILDQYALSQTQVRSLSQTLLQNLSTITGSSRADLNTATAVLLKMNVSPAVVMTYSWGGDNHTDASLAGEAQAHVDSVAGLNDLYAKLTTYALQDKVTIAAQNVFGRTLSTTIRGGNANGRDHNAAHHASVFIGKGFKPSVVGGVTLNSAGNDYRARGIASASGAPNDAGDIPYEQTLGAAGKTLGRALGLPQTFLDDQITTGKTVAAALV